MEKELLDTLLDYAPDLICMADLDGVMSKNSNSWRKILGWDNGELGGALLRDFVHPDDLAIYDKLMHCMKMGVPALDIDLQMRHRHGRYVWVQWRAKVTDDDLVIAFGRDINDIKKREVQAQNHIQLLELAEDTARVGHWRLDSVNAHVTWSQVVFDIVGRKANKSTMSIDDFIDAFHGEDRERFWLALQLAIQDGQPIDMECRLVRADGTLCQVHVRALCEYDQDHQIQGIFGIMQDVTRQNLHKKDLFERDELMRMTFKATSDGIWDWNLLTDEVWFSAQWKSQLGYRDEEIANTLESWHRLMFEEDWASAQKAMEAHIKGRDERFEMIQRFRHKKGYVVFILVRAYAIKDQRGQTVRMVGAHTDITQIKRLEQAKQEFTSIVSHELRTPLTAVHGAVGLLKQLYASEFGDESRSLLSIASNNSERLTMLVNDIMDMEKLQSGRMDFNIHPLVLDEILQNVVESLSDYALQFGVTLDYSDDGQGLQVLADRLRLLQVLSNLLSNAIKFSREGEYVKLRSHRTQNAVAISVIDRGRGIASDKQHQVFDRFFQADSSDRREKSGTGLGLAISKAIMEHMDGDISVISKEGEGSTFTVILPQAPGYEDGYQKNV